LYMALIDRVLQTVFNTTVFLIGRI